MEDGYFSRNFLNVTLNKVESNFRSAYPFSLFFLFFYFLVMGVERQSKVLATVNNDDKREFK